MTHELVVGFELVALDAGDRAVVAALPVAVTIKAVTIYQDMKAMRIAFVASSASSTTAANSRLPMPSNNQATNSGSRHF